MSPSRIIRAVSSWWMTAMLLVLLCGAYAFFSFGDSPFHRWTDFLFRRPPGIILYIALILNLAAATIRTCLRGLAAPVPSVACIKALDASAAIPSGGMSLAGAAELMRSWGFSPLRSSGGLVAVRGRYSFLPGVVFRTGMVLLLTSFLLSAHARETHETVFREGEQKKLLGATVSVGQVEANLPEDYFRVGEEGGFRLDKVSASASFEGDRHTVGTSFPTRAAGRYFRITHLGFVLPITLRERNVDSAKEAYIDVLPPGKTDTVSVGGSAVSIGIRPERTIDKGILKGEQFNLTKPAYRVAVNDGSDGKRAEVRLRAGESATTGGLRIGLGKSSLYVKIQAVRDPALPWIYAGLTIAAAGLAAMLSRFFWYRREFYAVEKDGAVYIGYTEEYFRKWGVRKFHECMKEFGGGDKA